jgi:glutamate carboxypeptidase
MRTARLVALALCTFLAATPSLRAQLTAIEQRIVEEVDRGNEAALELLERSVNVNSGSMNFPGVLEVGTIFSEQLDALGFETGWISGAEFGRAGHLLGTRPGDGPRVVLIGHLDTVFEPDSPFQSFERLSDTEAAGPGTTDMKGGNVVMIYALKALDRAGVLDHLDLRVVMTGDEEKSGRPLPLARHALRHAAKDANYAIGFEDGDGNPQTAVISRRGSSSWQLRVTGTPAHSSQIFTEEFGAGAIYEAARILTEFRERLATEPDLTFNPGVIVGGTDVELDSTLKRGTAFGKDNVIAESARVDGDLRALSPEQYARAKATMIEIASDNLPGTSAVLTFDDGYPPLAPTDGNRALLERYSQASVDLGLGPVAPVNPRNAGAADVSFVADLVPQVLDGVGLMGRGGHTVNEVADLTTLPTQTKRAALLLYRLSAE